MREKSNYNVWKTELEFYLIPTLKPKILSLFVVKEPRSGEQDNGKPIIYLSF